MNIRKLLSMASTSALFALFASETGRELIPNNIKSHNFKDKKRAFIKGKRSKSLKIRSNRRKAKK